jgi:hypothetical protein
MRFIKYVLFVVIIVVILSELLLSLIGFKRGYLVTPNEKIMSAGIDLVDTIYLTKMFVPDSSGIMMRNLNYDTAYYGEDFKHFGTVTFDMVYKFYAEIPINQEGFADIEFSKKDTAGKKKIMFIGDSFTWGFSAVPITKSFPNLIGANEKFVSYNLGVPGCDLASYLKLTQIHLSRIKPDYLIVNFFSNDFVNYDKSLIPFNYPDLFPTNAGGFYKQNFNYESEDSVELFDTYIDAYKYFEQRYTYRGVKNNTLQVFIKNSILLPQLYRIFYGYNLTQVNATRLPKVDNTYLYMRQIDSLCQKQGTKFILSIINSGHNTADEVNDFYRKVFKDIKFIYPVGIDPILDFTPSPDGHFNNVGHEKYATQLLELLLSLEQ